MNKSELPVYPVKGQWESWVYTGHNTLIAITAGDDHWDRACLIAHLINKYYRVEPDHFYPQPTQKGDIMNSDGQWAILEPMGRDAENIAGFCSKDGEMYQIEILGVDGRFIGTQLYGPKAIYRISFIDEEMAILAAKNFATPPPIVWHLKNELRRLKEAEEPSNSLGLLLGRIEKPKGEIVEGSPGPADMIEDEIPF